MPPKLLKVGITGGIGSGKTFVCKIFEVLGIDVYYADQRAKWLQQHNPHLIKQIKSAFGNAAYDQQGCLDRIFLAKEVFGNPKKLSLLNQLVHPKVAEDYTQWVKHRLQKPYTLKEAALLYETGSYRQLDYVINVDAGRDTRLQRVLERDVHRTKRQVEAIMNKQFGDEERHQLADVTIDNSGGVLIVPQIVQIHELLLEMATDSGK
ncbi:dephospho-CoA kinase [Tunicatimonas pelagia]|uniref:dephospho-CoA kinase n=1 Tax=Tunicatimonas pelagia TaxID=931531 RepID=UPI002666B2ED|nr:dephospho-CoA kinase [Tunicatimonas pelagia]WKN45548.1 dephospho-CoA kinase [Tunicatimonas pelagia]